MRITRLRPDRRAGESYLGALVVRGERRHREGRVAHEAMPAGARGADHAGLQVLRLAVEGVARIGDAPAERHHDGEARARPGGNFFRIAIAVGEIAHAARRGHLEAQQRRAVAGDAQAPAVVLISQQHDRLPVQGGWFSGIAGHATSRGFPVV